MKTNAGPTVIVAIKNVYKINYFSIRVREYNEYLC